MRNSSIKDFLKKPVSMCIQEKDGYTWFAASNRNGIYQMSNETKCVINKFTFEDEILSECMLYHNMEINGENIFFAPHSGKQIAVYNINKGEICYLPLKPVNEKYNKIYNDKLKFGNTFQDGSYVYLLGYTYPAIIKIHRETLEMNYIDSWVDELIDEISSGDARGYFTMGNVKQGRKILLPIGYMCKILELDLDTDEIIFVKLNLSLDGIGGIASENNRIVWMVGRGHIVNKIIKWDIENDVIKEIDCPLDEKNCLVPFYAPLCYKNRIFLFPVYSNYAYEINAEDESVTIHKIFENIINERDKKRKLPMNTFSPRIIDGKIKFIVNKEGEWYEYNLETGQMESFFVLDNEDIEVYLYEYAEKIFNEVLKENIMWEGSYDLIDYMDIICFHDRKEYVTNKNLTGNIIYSLLS